jgi:FtsZ-binding cell division protein ZapB
MMMETTFATAVDRIIGLENELEELRKKKAPKKNAMQGEKGS